MFNYVDYFEEYGRIMQFNKNKKEPIHRWYPFVEGYSKDFITSIINEMSDRPEVCLEPFSGSGTTALELQKMGIICHSFEVNPFMHLLSSVKLESSYCKAEILEYLNIIKEQRNLVEHQLPATMFTTLYESNARKKFNYYSETGIAINKIIKAIELINNTKYRDLFTVAIASILLDVSNLYRNGKCLSYKPNWKKSKTSEQDVFNLFDNKIIECIIPDIDTIKDNQNTVENINYLHNEDSREGINKKIENESVDIVITSPPYLNSRDYTDSYMLELKTLGMTPTKESIFSLRKNTIRSHVQINWDDNSKENDPILINTLSKLNDATMDLELWNNSIPDMINLYFVDIRTIFKNLYSKLKSNGHIYFNVSNSAYFGVLIDTLQICSSIAKNEGFEVEEIRKARVLKSSPQQKKTIGSLLEGVIVMRKPVTA